MIRIALAGSVSSTLITLQKLVQYEFEIVGVLGYEAVNTQLVSGYINMESYCHEHAIPYYPFTKVADNNIKNILRTLEPDIFFVVGLSQLIPDDMLSIAKLGNVGFHPTLLPRGRGRAPIAWLILEEKRGAANFFLMGAGADDGPVFVQEPFDVDDSDTALSIEQKIVVSIGKALDKWLPELKTGKWNPQSQDELRATWFGKRGPEDGWIDWQQSALQIDQLVRASAPPHPGAYSFLNNRKVLILEAKVEKDIPIKGVTGRILIRKNEKSLVQTGEGLLWVSKIYDEEDNSVDLKVGQKLGYYSELEIYKLKKEILKIKEKLEL